MNQFKRVKQRKYYTLRYWIRVDHDWQRVSIMQSSSRIRINHSGYISGIVKQ